MIKGIPDVQATVAVHANAVRPGQFGVGRWAAIACTAALSATGNRRDRGRFGIDSSWIGTRPDERLGKPMDAAYNERI
jgi:hypothetical protein